MLEGITIRFYFWRERLLEYNMLSIETLSILTFDICKEYKEHLWSDPFYSLEENLSSRIEMNRVTFEKYFQNGYCFLLYF